MISLLESEWKGSVYINKSSQCYQCKRDFFYVEKVEEVF